MYLKILTFTWLLFQSYAVDWQQGTHHDFQEIPFGKSIKYEFSFKNIGTEPLVIDNVRASCGCTATSWAQDPIPPDSTSVIKVDYDAKDKGYFYKKIKVYFKGIRKAEKLTVEGEVVE